MASVETETVRLATKDLRDSNPDIRAGAAKQLGKLRAVSAVPELIQTLDDEIWMVRILAVNALGLIGLPASAPAIPKLETLLSDSQPNVVMEVRKVLGILQK